MKTIYRVYCWRIKSDQYEGLIYDPRLARETLEKDTNVIITPDFDYRLEEPPQYMTYDISVTSDDWPQNEAMGNRPGL